VDGDQEGGVRAEEIGQVLVEGAHLVKDLKVLQVLGVAHGIKVEQNLTCHRQSKFLNSYSGLYV
jgi:hypothetical protein